MMVKDEESGLLTPYDVSDIINDRSLKTKAKVHQILGLGETGRHLFSISEKINCVR